jgi:hypothetical protein
MKRILQFSAVALALWACAARAAWNYQDGDVLLIFRESGFNDVEFDIGSINQFLNQANGSTASVTGWELSLVTNTFGADLTGVSVIVAATTSWTNSSKTAWLSSSLPNTTAYDATPSVWQENLWSVIDSIGTRPIIYDVPPAGTSAYSIDPGGSYRVASYDQIVDGNGVNAESLAELGGNAPFIVEQVIPGSFVLWGVQPSTANPKPADALVGSFIITTNGALTFVAGPPPSTILGITRSPEGVTGVTGVTFTTTVSGNYWLAYTNQLGAPVSSWPVVAGPLPGDGFNDTLTHTITTDTAGFYQVIRSP